MGTKLKNILRTRAVKLTAFILCVVMTVLTAVSGYFLIVAALENDYSLESLIVPDYLDSQEFSHEVNWRFSEISNWMNSNVSISEMAGSDYEIIYDYYITDGKSNLSLQFTGKEYFRFLDNYCIYEDGEWNFSDSGLKSIEILPSVQERLEGLSVYISFDEWAIDTLDSNVLSAQLNLALEELLDIFEDMVSPKAVSIADNFLLYYYYIDTNLEAGKAHTNVPNADKRFFENQPMSVFYENGEWSAGANSDERLIPNGYYGNSTLYAVFSADYLAQAQSSWSAGRNAMMPYLTAFLVFFLAALLMLIPLIYATGRKPEDPELHLTKLEKVHSDILLVAFAGLAALWVAAQVGINDMWSYRSSYYTHAVMPAVIAISTALIASCALALLLSMARKAKGKIFIKHSIIYLACRLIFRFFYKIYDVLKSLFDGRAYAKFPLTKALFIRQLVFICSSALLMLFALLCAASYIPEMCMIMLLFELVITGWYIMGSRKTYGDINKGFSESIEEQLKAERMKAELVTNVSHDLKTPLTSVISYVDLLSKEEGLSDTARDYVTILAEKSERLKNIVSDLFDLSKSTSGDISLELETIDLKRLIEQTMADMKDAIDSSGLVFKTKLPEDAVNIVSDGKKLYRVFQNVLDNALKYSLAGSRVFVGLEVSGGRAWAEIKNTSAYDLEFSAEDMLQRFTRGDKSRATEGSGLGLSIAESFTKVCGGDFAVSIDGDLFKVTVTFEAER